MNPEDLQVASYKGAEWLVTRAGLAGGRKDSKKVFVGSDLQVIEDLGLKRRVFTLSGTVAARRDNEGNEILSYQEARDTLLEALESGGTGVLIHPFLGRRNNIVCRTFSLTESTTSLGDSPIEITFEISDTTGLPIQQASVLGSVTSANDALVAAIEADTADRFSVAKIFIGNFEDALDKTEAISDSVGDATSTSAIADVDKLDKFALLLSDFVDDAPSLVDNPAAMSTRLNGIFTSMSLLYDIPLNTFDVFERLFDFGLDDVVILLTTAGRIERQKNRNVLNDNVQASALGYAYESGVQIEFQSVDDIDATSKILEDQYQSMIASGTLDTSVVEPLTELRIAAKDFFDQARVTASQVITVRTNFTTTRLLAYQYYGESNLGDTIAELNGLDDGVGVEGNLQILTS